MAGGKLSSLRKLKPRRRRFVELYCGEAKFNATKAARLAGYGRHGLSEEGYRLLRNAQIKQAIAERLEALAMSSEEAMVRLTQWGRGSLEPFQQLTATGDVIVSLATPEAQDNLHLIRKLEIHEHRHPDGSVEAKTKIELYDAEHATEQILRIRGKYVERHEHSGPDGGPIETHELSDADLLERAHHQANRVAALAVSVNGNGNGRHK